MYKIFLLFTLITACQHQEQKLQIDTQQGRAVAFGSSALGWDALWDNATDIEKAKLIYEYLHLSFGGLNQFLRIYQI